MEERYQLLIRQLDALLEGESDLIACLSNASALLYHNLDYINWVGFYLVKNDELLLGPFQGLTACMHIPFNKGVCGTAASTLKTQCVKDVHAFPGHIACDCASNSEIVVPMIKDGTLLGVLDIDSYKFSNFNEVDVTYLEQFVSHLLTHIGGTTNV